jgi:two-component system, response regulator, stage 0 sporulation protein F
LAERDSVQEKDKRRILIVDDEPAVGESLADFLEDEGFVPETASSAEEALEKLVPGRFQVCIADLRLPGMSGEDLILQAHRQDPHLICLIHTGSISYNLSDKLRSIGIRPDHVFHKPMREMTHLIHCIKSLSKEKDR